MALVDWSLLIFALVTVFVLGAIIGSFLNVCIARLPQEKSLLWPAGSRCGHCFQPVRWYDNVPLVSYWVLRGRCRSCGAEFSVRYFLIELGTALGFVGLFHLVALANVHQLPRHPGLAAGHPLEYLTSTSVIFFVHHAFLFCFLLIVAVCDLDRREIPLSVTFTGTAAGVVMAMFLPWPWPSDPVAPKFLFSMSWFGIPSDVYRPPPMGLWPWPAWWPPFEWLGAGGDWLTGLYTALVGLMVGTLLLRLVRFVFTVGLGIEALGMGDADLMMMAGSFLGWQPVVAAFFISPFPALVLTVGQYVFAKLRRTIKVRIAFNAEDKPVYQVDGRDVKAHRLSEIIEQTAEQTGRLGVHIYGPGTMAETVAVIEQAVKRTRVRRVHLTTLLPFGPSLALGVMVSCLSWRWIGPGVESLAFQGPLMLVFGGVGIVMMLVLSYVMRLRRVLQRE